MMETESHRYCGIIGHIEGSMQDYKCPDLESLWDIGKQLPVTRQIQLSHSDIGPYIHFVCPEKHHVVGPAMVTCLKGGIWDDVTEPYCSSSSLYGIPQSDTILIGVLAGSGAIVLITLTVILTHLFCLRSSSIRKATSSDGLHRSDDSLPSTTYYVDDQSYCAISAPTCPTMNGKPLKSWSRGQHPKSAEAASSIQHQHSLNGRPFDGSSNHRVGRADYFDKHQDNSAHASNVSGHVTTIADESVFVNYGYTREQSSMFSNHWDQSTAARAHESAFPMTSMYPKTDEIARTTSSSVTSHAHNPIVQTPSYNHYSTVNRTVL